MSRHELPLEEPSIAWAQPTHERRPPPQKPKYATVNDQARPQRNFHCKNGHHTRQHHPNQTLEALHLGSEAFGSFSKVLEQDQQLEPSCF